MVLGSFALRPARGRKVPRQALIEQLPPKRLLGVLHRPLLPAWSHEHPAMPGHLLGRPRPTSRRVQDLGGTGLRLTQSQGQASVAATLDGQQVADAQRPEVRRGGAQPRPQQRRGQGRF